MSHDPFPPTPSPWSPQGGPIATAEPRTQPQPTPRPPVASGYDRFGSQGAPPTVDHGWPGVASTPPTAQQPWPPTGPGSVPPTGRPPAAPPSASPAKPRRGGALVAVAVASALVAGTVGGAVGAVLNERSDDGAQQVETATPVEPVAEQGPVDPASSGSEPAAAVAAALSPAVVQIETGEGLGSGFIYDEAGLILTAFHVTNGSDTIEVRLADGSRVPAEIVGEDPSTDVAVLQIEPVEDMAVATLATGVEVEVGQTAIAIGSPFGLDQTVTAGIVSAVGRSAETPGGVIPAIQTDAPINSGNSGGALADSSGRVIGINDSIATGGGQSTGNLGIGFAIPIDIAKSVADRLVAGEPTDAGFLGVEGADATGERAGAAITAVSPGSPAAEAGLTESDVVVAVDGQPVQSMLALGAAIRTMEPGTSVELTVLRNGEERTVSVTLSAAPAN